MVHANAPGTLGKPPLSVEAAKVWPSTMGEAVGAFVRTGVPLAIVMLNALVPTPAALLAEIIDAKVPAADGLPLISPFEELTDSPNGRFDAPNEVGLLLAVML